MVVGGRVLMVMRHRLDRRRMLRGLAWGAHTQPRVEVAAAERHRRRQKEGNKEPEWTAVFQHTAEEYIVFGGRTP